jgi:hypothetical protein
VQNYDINLDFYLFLQRKSGGLSPQAMDCARVAGPRVHHGPHSGLWLELTGARPSGRSGAWWLAAEAPEARGRREDPSSGLAEVERRARRQHSVCEVLRERRVGGGVVWRAGGRGYLI